MTVSEMVTRLGHFLNDPNEDVFTSALKVEELNNAQIDFVTKVLAFGSKYTHVFDAIAEVQDTHTFSSITSTGALLSGITDRYFIRNGYVNASITDDDGVERWCMRLPGDKLGLRKNKYYKGTTIDPVIFFRENKIFLDIDTGSYPKDLIMTYVGKPYTLGTSASGSGKDQVVTTCELNILYHDIIVLMAESKLRRFRGTEQDIEESALVEKFVSDTITNIVTGAVIEPQAHVAGQQMRENSESR